MDGMLDLYIQRRLKDSRTDFESTRNKKKKEIHFTNEWHKIRTKSKGWSKFLEEKNHMKKSMNKIPVFTFGEIKKSREELQEKI